MAGRRPKPTETKRSEGNRGRRPLNNDFQTSPDVGQAPSYLSAKAKYAWRQLSQIFDGTGVLQSSDRYALERLCETYAEVRELQEDINTNGRTYKTTSTAGEQIIKQNPSVRALQEADKRFRSYLVEFGLTPSSRSRINMTNTPEKNDPLDEFL